MIRVRPAEPADAANVCRLLEQLGYRMDVAEIERRLAATACGGDQSVLVADDDGELAGVVVLYLTPMLHLARATARITALVVDDRQRGCGIGRLLVDAACEAARRAGSDTIELTTALHREHARRFYEAIGFSASSLRLHRPL